MSRPAKDLIGQRFGRLTVLRRYGTYRSKDGRRTWAIWLCRCDCGREVAARGDHLRAGDIKSCGCYRDEVIRKAQKMRWGNGNGKRS